MPKMPMFSLTGFPVIYRSSVTSTMDAAREAVQAGLITTVNEENAPAIAVVAEQQTQARGRFNRPWHSPKGGLWATLAWRGPATGSLQAANWLAELGLRTGVAIAREVDSILAENRSNLTCHIDWPNDLLVDGRKIGGCLIESFSYQGSAVALIGMGLNLNNEPPSLDPPAQAASLCRLTGVKLELDAARTTVLGSLGCAAARRRPYPEVVADARLRLWGVGRPRQVTLSDGSRAEGILQDLADDGRAIVTVGDQEMRLC